MPGSAQEFRSTLTGRIIDSQQAVVPEARITAVQVETGARYETKSGPDGQYTIPFLAPGNYSVTTEVSGFKRYRRDGVTLASNERQQLDIVLEIGQLSDSVTVTADAPPLETSSASTGQVITTKQVEDLPMNGRSPLVLAMLSFGATQTADPKFARPFDNGSSSSFSLGGAPAKSNELLLDGAADVNNSGEVAYNPPVDTVQEVKVELFNVDAAYGHTGGGTANMVLKSGTNTFHGSAYDFNQVSALAATPFFTNRAGKPKPGLIFNQWGLTAGAPLYIPKVFDGRNKVFWFFSYEGIKDKFPDPQTVTVPTAAERKGDFSALLAAGQNYQLYDPFSGSKEGSRVRRQVFPNNIIPASRLSAIGTAVMQFYPLPNQPGKADGADNYLAGAMRSDNYDSELGRLDVNLSERHKFFFNMRHNYRIEGKNRLFDNNATGRDLFRGNWGSMFDDVYTFTPTTLLNTRVNWTRYSDGNIPYSDGYDFTQLGFPAALAKAAPRMGLPEFSLDKFADLSTYTYNVNPYDIFQVFSTLTKIHGSHNLKFGVDGRMYRRSVMDAGNAGGSYSFGSTWTRGPLDNSTASPLGNDLASLLLGLPTGGSFDLNAFSTIQANYFALFVQDDFRVRPNLVLNIGLRYERDFPTTERFNRAVSGFDFASVNPVDAAARAAYAKNPVSQIPVDQFRSLGGLLFANSGNRAFYQTNARYFSPRFGFAWTPAALGGKTVIRGGTGVYFFPVGLTGLNQPGFSQSSPVVTSLDGGLTPYSSLANPFPDGIQQPSGSSLGLGTYLGRSVSYYNPDPRNAYSVRWTFDVQRDLGKGYIAEVAYVGNHAVHLPVDTPMNFVPRQYLSTSVTRDQAIIDRNSALVANPFQNLIPGTGLNSSTVSLTQLLRPFPAFTGITMQANNAGSSYSNALHVRLEKRFASGLQFLTNFQHSRTFERRSRLNESDPQLELRPADEDRPNRFVASVGYQLPFGKGKRFLGGAGPLVNRILGGWTVNGIYTYAAGAPVSWGNVIYNGGDLNWDPRAVDGAFDTTQFNRNSKQQLDQNIRYFPTRFGNLRADGINNLDFSILKNTPIKERLTLQYRAEFFNAMNHANFAGPQLGPTSSSFGTISSVNNLERHIQMALRLTW